MSRNENKKQNPKISENEETFLKKKTAKLSIYEGSAASLMDGFGVRYITPYALAFGATNTHIGILSSVPNLIGNLSQLYGSRKIEKISRKKIVFWSVLLQALMWLPLIGVGFLYLFFNLSSEISSLLIILFYTLLIMFGAYAGPAWNSWVKDFVTENFDYYFGKRNKIAGTVSLICMSLAGLILWSFNESDKIYGFAIILFLAFLGRSVSAYLFTKHYEPPLVPKKDYYFSFWQFVKRMKENNFGRFVIFSTLISFSVSLAAPFFAVYMLKDLRFDYFSFMLVSISPTITTLLSMPFWGKFSDKYGNVVVLKICGSLIFLVPLLWLFVPLIEVYQKSFVLSYLIVVEAFSGFIWAGFNLSSAMFIFHAVSRERLALCVAYNSILVSIGSFAGAFIGGLISSFEKAIFGIYPLFLVFLISSILRLAFFVLLMPKIKEVRQVADFKGKNLKEIISNIMHG